MGGVQLERGQPIPKIERGPREDRLALPFAQGSFCIALYCFVSVFLP